MGFKRLLIYDRCTVKGGLRDCICNRGYIGDGRIECRIPQRDCADLQRYFDVSQSGVSDVRIWGPYGDRKVMCDMQTDGGKIKTDSIIY